MVTVALAVLPVVLLAAHPVVEVVAAVVLKPPPSSAPSLAALPVLGVGLGFRPPFAADLMAQSSDVDFLEITLEHYLQASPAKRRELARLRERFTLIPHGLNLSLGSAEGPDPDYLEAIAQLIAELNPPWWSEHISFSRAGQIEIGHLSPLPFSHEALDTLCANIARVQQRIPCPLILENISYLLDLGGEMSEGEFIGTLLRRSGCGLLLDITNLYINAANHGYAIQDFLAALPLEHVVQLHFVGGHRNRNLLIDSHSEATPEGIWELMQTVLAHAPVKGIILERDENLPPFGALLAELERARHLGRQEGRWT